MPLRNQVLPNFCNNLHQRESEWGEEKLLKKKRGLFPDQVSGIPQVTQAYQGYLKDPQVRKFFELKIRWHQTP